MKFSKLIAYLPGARSRSVPGSHAVGDREVQGVTPRLREVRPGMAYFALPGEAHSNPHNAQMACQRGASLVVCGPELPLPAHLPSIRVSDPHAALATAAAAFQEFPAERLTLLAVTGDASDRRGVAHLLTSILNALGVPTARLGQNGFESGGRRGSAPINSLDAADIHALLGQHLTSGGRCVVTEFDAAEFPEGLTGLRFSEQITVSPPAVFRHTRPLLLSSRGSRIEIRALPVPTAATTPLVGRRSLLAFDRVWTAALAVAGNFGHSAAAVANTLPILPPVAGMLEPVQCGQPFGVLVDHATDAVALTAALRDARELTRGQLHVICGARAVASAMENEALGRAALALADQVHVTSDNPRRRSFQELRDELVGCSVPRNVTLQSDRAVAIRGALRSARTGDVVVLAGKADVPIQELGGAIVPFDDRVVAAQVLHARGYLGGSD